MTAYHLAKLLCASGIEVHMCNRLVSLSQRFTVQLLQYRWQDFTRVSVSAHITWTNINE